MARTKGSFNLAGAIEPLAAASLDARATVATKADLTASGSFPYFYKGMETYVVAENKKYRFVGDDPTVLSDWEEVTGGGQEIQVEELPTPSESLEGAIYQYVGETDSDYTNGYFYECVSDGQDPATYSWVQTNVQPSGGGGGSYTAGDGIDITNDIISTKQSEEGDIDEIIDVYPQAGNLVSIVNAFNRGDIYSTSERMIGQWIDGKPLYQIVAPCSMSQGTRHRETLLSINNVDTPVFAYANIGGYIIGGYWGSSANDYTGLNFGVDANAIGTVVALINGMETKNGYVVAQYTKTTDTAISIGEATEYSTGEKVVGTWIDGKPVFQRTLNLGTLSLSTSTTHEDIDVTTWNIETLIDCKGGGIVYKGTAFQGNVTFPQNYINDLGFKSSVKISTSGELLVIYKTVASSGTYTLNDAFLTLQYTKTTT